MFCLSFLALPNTKSHQILQGTQGNVALWNIHPFLWFFFLSLLLMFALNKAFIAPSVPMSSGAAKFIKAAGEE